MTINSSQDACESSLLNLKIPENSSAQKIEIIARIKRLEQRIIKVPTWSKKEIITLLEGARDAILIGNDVDIANRLFEQANGVFQDDSQIRNRNWYALSIVLGVLIAAAIGALILYFSSIWSRNLADPSTIASLIFFAVLGSATSIFTRLPDLDFREEKSKKYVIYSAISRPFVAISFASIIFIILKYKIINIQFGDGDPVGASYWVAAFLCGFSERFAPDLLERFSHNKSQ